MAELLGVSKQTYEHRERGAMNWSPVLPLPQLEREALAQTVLQRNPSLEAAREAWRVASSWPAQA